MTATDEITNFDLATDTIDISGITETGWSSTWDDGTDALSIDLNGDASVDMTISLLGVNATEAQVEAALIG